MIEHVEWAPEMLQLAGDWPLYESTCTNTGNPNEPRRTQDCARCVQCDCVVFPPDQGGVLVHLSSHHGYRMDGSRDPDSIRNEQNPETD